MTLSIRQLIERSLEITQDILKIDVVLGEQMLSESERLLPQLLAEEPAAYPRMVSLIEKTWHDYVLGVLMWREDREELPTCH